MVVQLIPFEQYQEHFQQQQQQQQDTKFKHIRKMAMIDPSVIQPTAIVAMGQGGTPRLTSISGPTPAVNFPPAVGERNQFYKDFKYNRAVQSELGQPIQQRVLSNLSRDVIDILQDAALDDDTKAANYLHAVKRYLTYKDKTNRLTPIAAFQPRQESEVVTPYHEAPYVGPEPPQIPATIYRPRPYDRKIKPHPARAPRARPAPAAAALGDAAKTPFGVLAAKLRPRDIEIPDSDSDPDGELDLFADAKSEQQSRGEASASASAYDSGDADDTILRGNSDDNDEVSAESGDDDDELVNPDKQRGLKVKDAVASVAPMKKKLAATLLKRIEKSIKRKDVGWNEQNELIVGGVRRPGTNMAQLLQNAVSVKPKKGIVGNDEFAGILQTAGLITAKKANQMLGKGRGNRGWFANNNNNGSATKMLADKSGGIVKWLSYYDNA